MGKSAQPENYDASPEIDPLLRRVESRDELLSHSFSAEANCFRCPRQMTGDFNALARRLLNEYSQQKIKSNDLPAIRQILERIKNEEGPVAQVAANTLGDLAFAEDHFQHVELRLQGYQQQHNNISTLHRDRGNRGDNGGALLCPYTSPTTRGARQDDCLFAEETEYGGLQFKLKPGKQGCRFQPGEMFRMAVMGNTLQSQALIHSGDDVPTPDSVPRMLMVARSLKSQGNLMWR